MANFNQPTLSFHKAPICPCNVCDAVTSGTGDTTIALETTNALLTSLLSELQNQPQIEGIATRPVCYSDGSTGSVGVKYDENLETYTPVYFDDQENVITSKTIVPCDEGLDTFLGDPIEVCI